MGGVFFIDYRSKFIFGEAQKQSKANYSSFHYYFFFFFFDSSNVSIVIQLFTLYYLRVFSPKEFSGQKKKKYILILPILFYLQSQVVSSITTQNINMNAFQIITLLNHLI